MNVLGLDSISSKSGKIPSVENPVAGEFNSAMDSTGSNFQSIKHRLAGELTVNSENSNVEVSKPVVEELPVEDVIVMSGSDELNNLDLLGDEVEKVLSANTFLSSTSVKPVKIDQVEVNSETLINAGFELLHEEQLAITNNEQLNPLSSVTPANVIVNDDSRVTDLSSVVLQRSASDNAIANILSSPLGVEKVSSPLSASSIYDVVLSDVVAFKSSQLVSGADEKLLSASVHGSAVNVGHDKSGDALELVSGNAGRSEQITSILTGRVDDPQKPIQFIRSLNLSASMEGREEAPSNIKSARVLDLQTAKLGGVFDSVLKLNLKDATDLNIQGVQLMSQSGSSVLKIGGQKASQMDDVFNIKAPSIFASEASISANDEVRFSEARHTEQTKSLQQQVVVRNVELSDVAKRIRDSISSNVNAITLKLKPVELGEVSVRISELNGEFTLKFVTDKKDTSDLLASLEKDMRGDLGGLSSSLKFSFGGGGSSKGDFSDSLNAPTMVDMQGSGEVVRKPVSNSILSISV